MRKLDMTIVNFIIMLIIVGIYFLLKREYAISYQENDEFFILNAKNKEIKVFYENIVDWKCGLNEIVILDNKTYTHKYIGVNIRIIKPEILLKKIAEKTFRGEFLNKDTYNEDDPKREQELIDFYFLYGYEYLLSDYLIDSKKDNK